MEGNQGEQAVNAPADIWPFTILDLDEDEDDEEDDGVIGGCPVT